MTMFTMDDAAQMKRSFYSADADELGSFHHALNEAVAPKVRDMIAAVLGGKFSFAAARAEMPQGATEADAREFWEREFSGAAANRSNAAAAEWADEALSMWKARFMPAKQEPQE